MLNVSNFRYSNSLELSAEEQHLKTFKGRLPIECLGRDAQSPGMKVELLRQICKTLLMTEPGFLRKIQPPLGWFVGRYF